MTARRAEPQHDDAPAVAAARGVRGNETKQRLDFGKATATAIARAALLGIEARSIGPAAWMLRHAHGACIGAVYGHEALAAAVAGFEAARDDVAALVQRLAGGGL